MTSLFESSAILLFDSLPPLLEKLSPGLSYRPVFKKDHLRSHMITPEPQYQVHLIGPIVRDVRKKESITLKLPAHSCDSCGEVCTNIGFCEHSKSMTCSSRYLTCRTHEFGTIGANSPIRDISFLPSMFLLAAAKRLSLYKPFLDSHADIFSSLYSSRGCFLNSRFFTEKYQSWVSLISSRSLR